MLAGSRESNATKMPGAQLMLLHRGQGCQGKSGVAGLGEAEQRRCFHELSVETWAGGDMRVLDRCVRSAA